MELADVGEYGAYMTPDGKWKTMEYPDQHKDHQKSDGSEGKQSRS